MGTENSDLRQVAQDWLDEFASALAKRSEDGLRALFRPDAYWRDLIALSGRIQTTHGADDAIATLLPLVERANLTGIALSSEYTPPSIQPRGDGELLEAFFEFQTDHFDGRGIFRLAPDEEGSGYRAAALMTSAQELKGHEWPVDDRRPDLLPEPGWSFETEDPDVVIVGAGQSGLMLAAQLRMIGVPTLVLERNERVGDNWRNRYESLKLHNIIQMNEFPFSPFPSNWPTYLPKDLYGGWLETYAENLGIEVWTGTTFHGGEYDDANGQWTVRISRDGAERTMNPRHVVMATGGFAAYPNVPELPGLAEFEGKAVHTSQVHSGEEFAGQKVIIVGTGVSAHDVAVELIGAGCEVSMVQRAPTDIVSLEAANLYTGLYAEREVDEADLIVAANSREVNLVAFQAVTQMAAEMDRDLIAGLEKAGFRTSLGLDDAGYFWDFLERGGGYYIDVGACKYVIDGTISVVQDADIERYGPKGAYLRDGGVVEADAVILATGYAPQEVEVAQLFGDEVAQRVGAIWGYGEDGELRNTWIATAQEGLWFLGGGIPQARAHSRFVALQLKTRLLGLEIGAESVSVGT